MRRDSAFVDLNHLVQTPYSSTLLLLVHLASIPGVSTAPPCSISQSSSIQMCERKRTLSFFLGAPEGDSNPTVGTLFNEQNLVYEAVLLFLQRQNLAVP